jgi:hypothetical protein
MTITDVTTQPTDVAAQVLHPVTHGLPEILADQPTGHVKQSLSASLNPA